jgi:hypothetical protein
VTDSAIALLKYIFLIEQYRTARWDDWVHSQLGASSFEEACTVKLSIKPELVGQ